MKSIFAKKTILDNKTNDKLITTDLNNLQQERELAKAELNLIKSRIKNTEIELAKTTANLEKTKSDFEILLTQQMLKKKETLNLEKEHKFILTEIASLTGHKQRQIIDLSGYSDQNFYPLLKEAIRDVMREEAKNQSKSSMKEESLIKKQGTLVDLKKQKSIDANNRFLYY